MNKLLWNPSEERIKEANITRFINFVNEKYRLKIDSYDKLYDWSIENMADFWEAAWQFLQIKSSLSYFEVIDDPTKLPGAQWFSGARLNFAENLLRYRDEHTALSSGMRQKNPPG